MAAAAATATAIDTTATEEQKDAPVRNTMSLAEARKYYKPLVRPVLAQNRKRGAVDGQTYFYSYNWVYRNHFLFLKNERKTKALTNIMTNHPRARLTALTGGTVYLPYAARNDLLKHIAYDIQTDTPIYWNQLAYDVEGEGFRLAVDVDTTRLVSVVETIQLSRILWQTLKAYYPEFDQNPIPVYASTCGPRLSKGVLCTGIHLMAHVQVNMEQALQLIYGFKIRLQDSQFNLDGIDVDAQIYRTNSLQCSLRMIYCHKKEVCPLCQNKDDMRIMCDFCNSGFVISKSTYEPKVYINPLTGQHDKAEFDRLNPDFERLLRNFSLWPDDPSERRTDYQRPSIDPCVKVVQRNTQELNGKGPKGAKGKRKRKRPGAPRGKMVSVPKTSPFYGLVKQFLGDIEFHGHHWYRSVTIRELAFTAGKNILYVYVDGLGSSMCPYANKDHGGNRVWFKISKAGVLTVYCHSEKHGCTKQPRLTRELPDRLTNRLFDIEGPPSFHPSGRRNGQGVNKRFSFSDFYRRRGTDELNSQKKRREHKHQQNADKLAAYYKLDLVQK